MGKISINQDEPTLSRTKEAIKLANHAFFLLHRFQQPRTTAPIYSYQLTDGADTRKLSPIFSFVVSSENRILVPASSV